MHKCKVKNRYVKRTCICDRYNYKGAFTLAIFAAISSSIFFFDFQKSVSLKVSLNISSPTRAAPHSYAQVLHTSPHSHAAHSHAQVLHTSSRSPTSPPHISAQPCTSSPHSLHHNRRKPTASLPPHALTEVFLGSFVLVVESTFYG